VLVTQIANWTVREVIEMARASSSEERILASFEHGDTLAVLTAEIFKVAKRDGINLDKAFDDKKAGQKAFNDQLRVALHICEERGTNGIRKIVYSKRSQRVFRSSNQDKKSEDYKRKEGLRSNFAHDLKLAAQVAAGLIDMNANITMGQENGTLVVFGRGVAKQLNVEPIILKPKQARGVDEKGTARMSYSEIAANAAKKRHATLRPRVDSRRAVATLESETRLLVEAIKTRRGSLTTGEKVALTALQSLINKSLDC
jgi:hypothetical protein